jgi:hypothetical protein
LEGKFLLPKVTKDAHLFYNSEIGLSSLDVSYNKNNPHHTHEISMLDKLQLCKVYRIYYCRCLIFSIDHFQNKTRHDSPSGKHNL